jgi:hypothetical protein
VPPARNILLYFVRLTSASANEPIHSVMDPKYLRLSNGDASNCLSGAWIFLAIPPSLFAFSEP